MSRYTQITIRVEKFDQNKEQVITDALTDDWPFEMDDCGPGVVTGTGCDSLSGTEKEMLVTLQKAAWKANGAFCEVVVEFNNLETLPGHTTHSTKKDYDKLKLAGDLDD